MSGLTSKQLHIEISDYYRNYRGVDLPFVKEPRWLEEAWNRIERLELKGQ